MPIACLALFTILIFCSVQSFSQEPFWVQTNGPPGGEVIAIAYDRGRDICYVASLDDLYRSMDEGASWTRCYVPISIRRPMSITIGSDGTVLVASDTNLIKSNDGGRHWQLLSLPFMNHELMSVVSYGLQSIYLNTRSSSGYKILHTSDDGLTWTSYLEDTLLTLVLPEATQSSGGLFIQRGKFVYRVMSNGIWALITETSTFSPLFLIQLDSLLWIRQSLEYCTRDWCIFASDQSFDGGNTWKRLIDSTSQSVFFRMTGAVRSSQGVFISTLAGVIFSKTPRNLLYHAVNAGLPRGERFRNVPDRQAHGIIRTRSDVVLLADGGGAYRFANASLRWVRSDRGMRNGDVTCLSINSAGDIYATTLYGLFRSGDAGETWTTLGQDEELLNKRLYAVATDDLGSIVTGVGYDGTDDSVWALTAKDSGSFWRKALLFGGLSVRAICSPGPRYFVLGTLAHMYASYDGGMHWQITSLIGAYDFAFSHSRFLVTASGPEIRFSYDQGFHWESRPLPFGRWISKIGVGKNGWLFGHSDLGFISSSDTGRNWKLVTHARQFLSSDRYGGLYATHDDPISHTTKLFRSSDNGENWTNISEGIDQFGVADINFDSNGYAYLAIRNGGLFRSTIPLATITSVEPDFTNMNAEFSLSPAFPNPFNPTTRFEIRIPKYEIVTLKIFNLLGEEVATLVDEEKLPGSHSIEWDASGFPSGVYFYRMKAGSFSAAKKLLLVK